MIVRPDVLPMKLQGGWVVGEWAPCPSFVHQASSSPKNLSITDSVQVSLDNYRYSSSLLSLPLPQSPAYSPTSPLTFAFPLMMVWKDQTWGWGWGLSRQKVPGAHTGWLCWKMLGCICSLPLALWAAMTFICVSRAGKGGCQCWI